MQLARLETFRDVARLGSLAAAARTAGVDPSVVSRSIAALEQDLGVRLFQRSTRRLSLTEAGSLYLGRVEGLIDELEAARDEVCGFVRRPRGRLRVTASSAFGQTMLAPMLPHFHRTYPEIELELILTDDIVDLVSDQIDVAIRLGERPDGDMVAAQLTTTEKRVVASPEYLSSAPEITEPADLGKHACLAFPFSDYRSTWLFRSPAGLSTSVAIRPTVVTSNAIVLRDLAISGLGVTLAADWLVAPDIEAGRLKVVLPSWTAAARSFATGVWVAYPSRRHLPQKARLFIDHLRERMLAA